MPPVCTTAGVPRRREARTGAQTVSEEPAETSRFIKGKESLKSMDDERTLGGERIARLLVGAGEPCGRMRAGNPPAEKRSIGGIPAGIGEVALR